MQLFVLIVGWVMLSVTGLNAFPHTASQLEPRDALTPLYELGNNYTVYPIRWTGQVHRGGPNVTLQGDNMMVVKKQILNLNPSYDPSEFLNPAAHNATKDHLARRNAMYPPNCNPPFWIAPCDSCAVSILNYWININVNLPLGAGPGWCASMSPCDQHTAIYVCNDTPYDIQPAIPYLMGNYAGPILSLCTRGFNSGGGISVLGQEFDTDGYNVLVAWC